MLATFMRRMRNNNLEIRIVGSSCRHNNVALLDDADNFLVLETIFQVVFYI